ncbi:uncharacterized protein BJ171DRAFT_516258 [Polychytrium aggregatum]|uniref:uncharacterized protein n=1 Tax=Polychytrium aggregatum TaxID=110093 RepID=UPI0022FE46D7|nr:uncharacterized protein BJ171DRAFT_516258 [Polychytrium aggregatum]KAI9202009.1 hypothetical protein BJ171DRAFT_516258 [Polychytrium aggregatum]
MAFSVFSARTCMLATASSSRALRRCTGVSLSSLICSACLRMFFAFPRGSSTSGMRSLSSGSVLYVQDFSGNSILAGHESPEAQRVVTFSAFFHAVGGVGAADDAGAHDDLVGVVNLPLGDSMGFHAIRAADAAGQDGHREAEAAVGDVVRGDAAEVRVVKGIVLDFLDNSQGPCLLLLHGAWVGEAGRVTVEIVDELVEIEFRWVMLVVFGLGEVGFGVGGVFRRLSLLDSDIAILAGCLGMGSVVSGSVSSGVGGSGDDLGSRLSWGRDGLGRLGWLVVLIFSGSQGHS